MNTENLTEIKATIVAVGSALCSTLGWKGIMALVWVCLMLIDYASGTAAAIKAHDWSSAEARDGIWHKAGMILVVTVSAIADGVMAVICGNIPVLGMEWPGLVFPLVLAWYILTELGSILENANKMGGPVPAWLVRLLRAGLKAVDTAGDGTSDSIDSGK